MTAKHDPDRLIRAFLDEGTTELPDRTFDSVRVAIERTHQRGVIAPWREFTMSTLIRGLAAAAVITVAIAGLTFVPRFIGIGTSSSSPSLGPSASPSPAATPAFPTYEWPAVLAAGTYNTSFVWELPFALRFTTPAGWQSRDIEILQGTDADPVAWVSFQLVDNVYSDPCAHTLADPAVGPGVADLANAIAALPRVHVTRATDATIGTLPATYLEYTDAGDAPACSQDVRLWSSPTAAMLPFGPHGAPDWPLRSGSHRVWVVDVGGLRLVIDAGLARGASEALLQEELAIVDSLDFKPLSEIRAVGYCALDVVSPAGDILVDPPYRLRLQGTQFPVRGAFPVGPDESPLTPKPPLAQLDVRGASWLGNQSNPITISLVPPIGQVSRGFTTATTVGGFQGSAVFDSPGTWWVRVVSSMAGCARQFPVEVAGP